MSPWVSQPRIDRPDWASDQCTFTRVRCLMHLGHPLPACFRISVAFDLVKKELQIQLDELHKHPIQTLDRALLVNTLVAPSVLYRTECLPLSSDQLRELGDLLQRFVLAVTGLPPRSKENPLHASTPQPGPGVPTRATSYTCARLPPPELRTTEFQHHHVRSPLPLWALYKCCALLGRPCPLRPPAHKSDMGRQKGHEKCHLSCLRGWTHSVLVVF